MSETFSSYPSIGGQTTGRHLEVVTPDFVARDRSELGELSPTEISRFNVVIAIHNLDNITEQLDSLNSVVHDHESQITFVANGDSSEEIYTYLHNYNNLNRASYSCLKTPKRTKGKDLSVLHFMNHLRGLEDEGGQDLQAHEANLIILDADSYPEDANVWLERSKHHLENQSSDGAFLISGKKYEHGVDIKAESSLFMDRILDAPQILREKAQEGEDPELSTEADGRWSRLKTYVKIGTLAMEEILPVEEAERVANAKARTLLSRPLQKRILQGDIEDFKAKGTKYFGAGESYAVRMAKKQFDEELQRYTDILSGKILQIWGGEDQWRIMKAKEGMVEAPENADMTLMNETRVITEDAGKISIARFAILGGFDAVSGNPSELLGRLRTRWNELSRQKYSAQKLGNGYDAINDKIIEAK